MTFLSGQPIAKKIDIFLFVRVSITVDHPVYRATILPSSFEINCLLHFIFLLNFISS